MTASRSAAAALARIIWSVFRATAIFLGFAVVSTALPSLLGYRYYWTSDSLRWLVTLTWVLYILVIMTVVISTISRVEMAYAPGDDFLAVVPFLLGATMLLVSITVFLWRPVQILHDRGVVETATIERQVLATQDDDGNTSYEYSLSAVDGPPIHGTLDTDRKFETGARITVVADPTGSAGPRLRDGELNPGPYFVAVLVMAGIAIASSGFSAARVELALRAKARRRSR
jgi:hypothetical protein